MRVRLIKDIRVVGNGTLLGKKGDRGLGVAVRGYLKTQWHEHRSNGAVKTYKWMKVDLQLLITSIKAMEDMGKNDPASAAVLMADAYKLRPGPMSGTRKDQSKAMKGHWKKRKSGITAA